ncbi:hypothetical protein [Xenorhabdus bovienii]|uniref:hypothetical protein n=1 Tax=Xenorhabdus bovienii TaxID=40576 RepID=UPI0021571871|nr:hypothetical protein [Xenorhabdus bovienii]
MQPTIIINILFNKPKTFIFHLKALNVHKEIVNVETTLIQVKDTEHLLSEIKRYEDLGYIEIACKEMI